MTVIAFTGPAGCGKNEAAQYLRQHVPTSRTCEYAFAQPMREMLLPLLQSLGMSRVTAQHALYTQAGKAAEIPALGKTPRYLLQTLGTEWGRELIHPDLWLKCAAANIQRFLKSHDYVFVTDCRFDNEAAMIRRNGGLVVHILTAADTQRLGHASEAGVTIEAVDYTIDNTGTLDEYHDQLATFLEALPLL